MRLRYREKSPPSRLEARFAPYCRSFGGPELERGYRFYARRKWRADFAHVESRTLIEIEGGIWVLGYHNCPQGFAADAETYLAGGVGWLARPAPYGASDHCPDRRTHHPLHPHGRCKVGVK